MPRFQHRKKPNLRLRKPTTTGNRDLDAWIDSVTRILTDYDDQTTLAARVTRDTNQATTSGVEAALTFTVVRWNNGGLFASGTPTRLVAPVSGIYLIGAQVEWEASATGTRVVTIRYNGTDIIARTRVDPTSGTSLGHETVTEWPLNEGDYVEALVMQTSGGALNVLASGKYSPEFWMSWDVQLQE